MTYLVPHFIQGQKTSAPSSQTLDIYNPVTGETAGKVAVATKEEIESAIAAAGAAFPAWSTTPVARRAKILYQFYQLIQQHRDELATLISQEHGKTLADASGELERGLEVIEFACGIPSLIKGEYSAGVSNGVDTFTLRQPLGICVGITPFNFPAMIQLWMYPLAIACGNTFIVKPSEKDPAASIRLAELFKKAGLPDGVLNIVNGDKEVVDRLLTHPEVKAISFVGSSAIAQYVYATSAAHGKRVQCGGGAKNHAIVMPDADMEQTVDAIVGAVYGSAGERCMAISAMVIVGENTADTFIKKFKKRTQQIKMGHSFAKETEMGPLVTAAHYQRVKSYVDLGVAEGAELILDGRSYQHAEYKQGFFLGPCIFDRVTPNMRIYKEEIFGPVLTILRAKDFETALTWVNNHEYGNGTSIFTQSGYIAQEFYSRVQIGLVGVNVPIPVPVGYHTFAGWKHSYFGDTEMYGTEGVRFYTKIKTVTQRWPIGKYKADFTIPSSSEPS